MPNVLTTLAGWSSTSASNKPAGSDTVGSSLDDDIRELQGVIVRGLSHKGADIASASTTDLGAVEGAFHDVTGTTTITSFGTVRAGIWKIVKFEGALTLTHNSTSLILPGAANITTANGDVAIVISEGSGNWRCLSYMRVGEVPRIAGQFTSSFSGPFNATSVTITYERLGNQITLHSESCRPEGNNSAAPITMDMTSMPSTIRPRSAFVHFVRATDNDVEQSTPAEILAETSGNWTINKTGGTTNFTATTLTVGVYGWTMSYLA